MPLYIGTSQPDYVRYAVQELRALDPDLDQVELLADGLFRFAASLSRTALAAALGERPPIFLRHLHPVGREVPLGGDEDDLRRIAAAAEALLAGITRGAPAAVQVRRIGAAVAYSRFAVKERLDPVLAAAGAVPVVQAPQQVLSVTIAGATAYLGLSTPEENLSARAGGEVRYRREGLCSRAAFKLLECFETLGIQVRAGGSALDLGAAPGGWTQVLLERGLHVTAVDPAELDPVLRDHPRLTYHRRDARAVDFPPGSFDLLTCDMNWDPIATARLVAARAPVLKPGGTGVLTVKLLPAGPPARLLREVSQILAAAGLSPVRSKQLFHNRDEVTILLHR